METVAQFVTVALAVLAIIWHQQRSTDKLRDGFERTVDKLRDDFNVADREHRTGLSEVKERLSRIEGFLRIGMPEPPEPESEP